MAADLTADIEEAEAEGGSAEDVLGSSVFDPRQFAAAWADARGVTAPPTLCPRPLSPRHSPRATGPEPDPSPAVAGARRFPLCPHRPVHHGRRRPGGRPPQCGRGRSGPPGRDRTRVDPRRSGPVRSRHRSGSDRPFAVQTSRASGSWLRCCSWSASSGSVWWSCTGPGSSPAAHDGAGDRPVEVAGSTEPLVPATAARVRAAAPSEENR